MAGFFHAWMAGLILSIEPNYPGLKRSWWPMLLLFLAANLYSIDKSIVGVLAEPISQDLALNDVQMGLLLGLAYTVLNGICGLWLGSLIDRHTRCKILGGAIILWSLATAAGGLAPDFKTFFALRALVGLGEAAVAPAAVSLIADMFSPQQRGRAISTYLFGATIGTALSSIIPGFILDLNLHLSLPIYGLVTPWRVSFLICGLVGPVVGILFLTVREPARRGQANADSGAMKVMNKLQFIWLHKKIFVPLLSGVCLFYIAFVAIASWMATFIMRKFDIGLPAFANEMGLALLISGALGYFSGGLAADSKFGRGARGKLTIMAILPVLAVPATLAVVAPTPLVALVLLCTIMVVAPVLNVSLNTTVQDLLPNEMRGFTYAFISVIAALPAGAGGPLAVAFVTEYVFQDQEAIGLSLLVVCLPALVLASLAFAMARRATAVTPKAAEEGEMASMLVAPKPI
ncbi:hypothetical protein AZE99_12620 [Sphingorhabdus sp. M41]|nr:hypothetical protein AZE99_12620 [Sphingorhabdus sp. M41]